MANHSHDFAGPSSSQQPFSSPQPVQAASPPTKQNLKSWWAGFRKEGKKHETQGKYNLRYSSVLPSRDAFAREDSPFLSKSPRSYDPQFRERSMEAEHSNSKSVNAVNHMAGALAPGQRRRSSSLQESLFNAQTTPVRVLRPSASLLKVGNTIKRFRRKRSMTVDTQHTPKPEDLDSSHLVQGNSEISDTLKGGKHPISKAGRLATILAVFKSSPLKSKKENANSKTEPQNPGIFGVPLRQSITYANVAISLVDSEGKSYIYGYVPIVVAKCGVYLKEKGMCRVQDGRKRANSPQQLMLRVFSD